MPPLPDLCPRCGTPVAEAEESCPTCGYALGEAARVAEAQHETRAEPGIEREGTA